MLTTDSFREIADCIFDETQCPVRLDLCSFDGAIIFIRSSYESLWFSKHHSQWQYRYVLISGNSDSSNPRTPEGLAALEEKHSKLLGWFAVNPSTSNYSRLFALPIGIKNFAKNGALGYDRNPTPIVWNLDADDLARRWKEKLKMPFELFKEETRLAMYFTLRAANKGQRESISKCLAKWNRTSQIPPLPALMPFEDLIENVVKKSQFTVSPPGTGMDCYRTWEALLSTSVPIIQAGLPLNSALKCLPVVEVEDFCSLNDTILRREWTRVQKSSGPYAFQRALAPYWIYRIFKLAGRLPPVTTKKKEQLVTSSSTSKDSFKCPASGIITLTYMTNLPDAGVKAWHSRPKMLCPSLESFVRQDFQLVMLGYLTKQFTGFGQRMDTLRTALKKIVQFDPDCIVFVTDILDAFATAGLSEIKRSFLQTQASGRKVVFGSECECVGQFYRRTQMDKTMCGLLPQSTMGPSQTYRYINGGLVAFHLPYIFFYCYRIEIQRQHCF